RPGLFSRYAVTSWTNSIGSPPINRSGLFEAIINNRMPSLARRPGARAGTPGSRRGALVSGRVLGQEHLHLRCRVAHSPRGERRDGETAVAAPWVAVVLEFDGSEKGTGIAKPPEGALSHRRSTAWCPPEGNWLTEAVLSRMSNEEEPAQRHHITSKP